ncbi:Hpt domain-containing protein [Sphingomonas montana]|uniref:Hpt domain-containing protein n=1 Tax=Sphingomonas montana TaxID=1843236 RepID=UPI00096E51C2|nr:Hpt domain-containing protein [Sphingomonas montana]
MAESDGALVDWTAYHRAQAELGGDFVRILGYFREDGVKSVGAIEEAMRHRCAAALVLPAHTLKGDSVQLGATRLSSLAEVVEMTARRCVERHESPDELLEEVVQMRPLFQATMTLLNQAAGQPLIRRPQGFGRKVVFGQV